MDELTSQHVRRSRWQIPLACGLVGVLIGLTGRSLLERHESAPPEPDVHVLAEVIAEVRDNYVEPRTERQLLEDGIRGVMSGLDEHSVFLDQHAYVNLTEQTTGHFGGIGVEVTFEEGAFRIIAPIDDTPAQHAGLYAGDELISIDTEPVLGRTLDQVTDALRGEPGTSVQLAVRRDGFDLDFAIERATIDVDSVRSRFLEPGYGYVRISQFQTGTGPEFVKAIETLEHEHGPLAGTRARPAQQPRRRVAGVGRSGRRVPDRRRRTDRLHGRTPAQSADLRFLATGPDLLHGAPLVVLINKGSASASEIVAGALQDHRRALVLGSTSYGKGSVQAVLPLDRSRALKLTTALYFTPNGRSIQSKGIHPDVEMNADGPDNDDGAALLTEAVRQLKQAHRG